MALYIIFLLMILELPTTTTVSLIINYIVYCLTNGEYFFCQVIHSRQIISKQSGFAYVVGVTVTMDSIQIAYGIWAWA